MKINSTDRKIAYKVCLTCFRSVIVYDTDNIEPCHVCGTKPGEGIEIMTAKEGRQNKTALDDKHREWILDRMVQKIKGFSKDGLKEFARKMGQVMGYRDFIRLLKEIEDASSDSGN